jgi:outer membrane receptor for ferrienterochelin and colicin
LLSSVAYAQSEIELLDLSLEDLSLIEVGSTANRYETQYSKSASNITVITEEEIARHGYKTLEELLQNVVGFDQAYHIFRPLVSNRGFRQDINTNYLLLIDGHRVNENAYSGFGMEQIFPLMDNIKKVEVIRGAGSTLWGGSALNGIIAITTKKASEYANSNRDYGMAQGSIDYEFENQRTILNATYAKTAKDYDFTLSTIYFDNDVEPTHLYGYGRTDGTPYKAAQASYNFKPSYQIYSKLKYDNLALHYRYSSYTNQDNLRTSTDTSTDGYTENITHWAELIYTPQLTHQLSLEARISFDDKKKTSTAYPWDGSTNYTDRIYEDKGFNGEVILHQNTPNYHLLVGAFAQNHKLTTYVKDKYAQDLKDQIYAGFAEINYIGVEDWIFTLGSRYEYSDDRGDTTNFLPRFMIYKHLKNNSYLKYIYNTGSLRPTLTTTRGFTYEDQNDGNTYYAQGAQNSQTSRSHSLVFGYNSKNFQITTTLFYDKIKDLVLWGSLADTGEIIDGAEAKLWETNLVDITQKGVEIEAKWHMVNTMQWYATYSYADTTYDDENVYYKNQELFNLIDYKYTDSSLQMAGAAQQVWNLGYDLDLSSHIAWNLNYHGRYGVLSIYPDSTWQQFGFEHFFDTNLRYLRVFSNNSELNFYVKNITDNRGRFPTGYGEVQTQLGRQVGVMLKFIY